MLLLPRAVATQLFSGYGGLGGCPTAALTSRPLLCRQILNPFYIFQAFTLILWYTQGYVEYSSAIVILSVISIGLTTYDLRQVSSPPPALAAGQRRGGCPHPPLLISLV